MSVWRWGLVVVATAAVSACSVKCEGPSVPGLNMDKVPGAISGMVETNTGVRPEKVTCPDSAPLKKGHVFECQAMLGALSQQITVTQDTDDGHVQFEFVGPKLVSLLKVEKLLVDQVKAHNQLDVTAACQGPRMVVSEPGSHFDCEIRDPSGALRGRARANIKDAEATVDIVDQGLPEAPGGGVP